MVALSNIGAYRARARESPATTSVRPLRTNAEDIVIESSSHWIWGGTSTSLRRDGVRLSGRDDRGRVEQVGAFVVIQLQGASDRVEDVFGHAADVPFSVIAVCWGSKGFHPR